MEILELSAGISKFELLSIIAENNFFRSIFQTFSKNIQNNIGNN
jgi:hypothetical protein